MAQRSLTRPQRLRLDDMLHALAELREAERHIQTARIMLAIHSDQGSNTALLQEGVEYITTITARVYQHWAGLARIEQENA